MKKRLVTPYQFDHLVDLCNILTSYCNQNSETFKGSSNPRMQEAYDVAKGAASRIRELWSLSAGK